MNFYAIITYFPYTLKNYIKFFLNFMVINIF